MKRFSFVLALALVLALGMAVAASAAPKVMKVSLTASRDRSYVQGMFWFAEQLEKNTNGSIKVQVYTDSQLGGDRDNAEGLQMGSIQGGLMSPSSLTAFSKRMAAISMPFMFKDDATAYKVLDSELAHELFGDLDKINIVGLNYWENGFRNLSNSKLDVKSTADVAGLKLRTMEVALHIDIWRALGADPTPIAYAELFTALQQKVVDGQENPIGNIVTARFYEVQKYVTLTRHIYDPLVFMTSKKFWNSLTDEEKAILQKTADDARDHQRKLNAQEDIDGIEFLKSKGITVTELSDEARAEFIKKMEPIYEKYGKDIGEEYFNKLRKAAQGE